MDKDIKITMTLENLRILLDEQKKNAGEAICRVAHMITQDGKTDTSVIRNEVRTARYPDDYQTLKRYL